MRVKHGSSLLAAMALGALLALAACRPLYLPPVPDAPPFDPGARVATFTAEPSASGRPRVELTLAGLANAGWLSVQWMAPTGSEVASASVWLEPTEPTAVFELPDDVELRSGEWRAVVSFEGSLLRQFTFTVE